MPDDMTEIGAFFFVNDDRMALCDGDDVAALLARIGLDLRKVAVERNGEILPRSQYGQTGVKAGDRFEIVHFIGGG